MLLMLCWDVNQMDFAQKLQGVSRTEFNVCPIEVEALAAGHVFMLNAEFAFKCWIYE